VTLTAPAGYSKTTCLAEWAVHERRPFAWAAVNRRHNDEILLITAIVEALEEIDAIDPRVRASLAGPNPAISTGVLPHLGRSIRERSQPFVLAVDDLHLLTSTDALEVLEAVWRPRAQPGSDS
jgi:LuxR family maltose regulon positive regulatory protein